jgi:hypothetical protein
MGLIKKGTILIIVIVALLTLFIIHLFCLLILYFEIFNETKKNLKKKKLLHFLFNKQKGKERERRVF